MGLFTKKKKKICNGLIVINTIAYENKNMQKATWGKKKDFNSLELFSQNK